MENTLVEKMISPMDDVMFKRIFGEKENLHLLEDLLSSILEIKKDDIEGILLENTEQNAVRLEGIKTIVDVKVKMKSGKIIIIEMQKTNHKYLAERLMFYNSRSFIDAIQKKSDEEDKKDKKKKNTYAKLSKTITILLANFEFFNDYNVSDYHDTFCMKSIKNDRILSTIQEIHVIEIPKVPKGSYPWIDFIGTKDLEVMQMAAEKNPIINDAIEVVRYFSADEMERHNALRRELAEMDEAQRLYDSWEDGNEEGKEEGRAEGRAEGKEEGRAEGKEEGRAEGKAENMIEVAQKMLSIGAEKSMITEVTGFTEEQLADISKSVDIKSNIL